MLFVLCPKTQGVVILSGGENILPKSLHSFMIRWEGGGVWWMAGWIMLLYARMLLFFLLTATVVHLSHTLENRWVLLR